MVVHDIDAIHNAEGQTRSQAGFAFISRDFRFLQVNQTMADLDGCPLDQHLGQSISSVLPEQATRILPLLQQVLDSGTALIDVEMRGARSHWLASYYPLQSQGGYIAGIDMVAHPYPTSSADETTADTPLGIIWLDGQHLSIRWANAPA